MYIAFLQLVIVGTAVVKWTIYQSRTALNGQGITYRLFRKPVIHHAMRNGEDDNEAVFILRDCVTPIYPWNVLSWGVVVFAKLDSIEPAGLAWAKYCVRLALPRSVAILRSFTGVLVASCDIISPCGSPLG